MTLELPFLGFGHALPRKAVDNASLVETLAARGVETNAAWIESRTGILQRYICGADEGTLSLAKDAVAAALADAGVAAADVSHLIVATCSPERTFPSTAALVQGALGLPVGCVALDVNAACGGFIAALQVARGLLLADPSSPHGSGAARGKGLAVVVGVDVFSRLVDWDDRGTCVLFGDGAGAVVMGAREAGKASGPLAGLLAVRTGVDGAMAGALQSSGGVSLTGTAGHVLMNGREVFKHAVRQMGSRASAESLLAQAGLCLDDVDWVVPHQANVRILEAAAKEMGVDWDKVIVTVDRHANTSAASIPLAMAASRARLKPGNVLLLQAFGAGFVWGEAVVRL